MRSSPRRRFVTSCPATRTLRIETCQAHKSRLARAGGPEQRRNLTSEEFHVNTIEDRRLIAGDAEAADCRGREGFAWVIVPCPTNALDP